LDQHFVPFLHIAKEEAAKQKIDSLEDFLTEEEYYD